MVGGVRVGMMGRIGGRALLLAVMMVAPVWAQVHVDVVVGVDPAGKLVASAGTTSFPLPPSRLVGLPGYAGTSVGFRSVDPGAATDALRALDPGAHVAFELLYTDPGLAVIDEEVGAPVRRGNLVKLGVAPFDTHPLWSLAADGRGPRKVQLRLRDRAEIHEPGPVMTLTFTPDPKTEAWLCPMRCEGPKAYDAPGRCPHCGTPLSLATAGRWGAEVTPVPRSLQADTPARLGIALRDPEDKAVTVDDGALDAYVVSADLSSFAYGRPARNPDGTFTLPATFPDAGLYTIFLELAPARVGVQIASTNVVVAGPDRGRERLAADATPSATVAGHTITLTTDGPLVPLHEIACRFAVTRDGSSVPRLAPVRGAPGQLVIVGDNRSWFLHRAAHAAGAAGGSAATFRCVFPKPGVYRMWVQVQPGDDLLTVPFTVRVVRGDAVRARRTSAAEGEGVDGGDEAAADGADVE